MDRLEEITKKYNQQSERLRSEYVFIIDCIAALMENKGFSYQQACDHLGVDYDTEPLLDAKFHEY
ncbi:MAG: hypothetical protein ACQERN_15340 [Thermodesulfobacteriota bacterium]